METLTRIIVYSGAIWPVLLIVPSNLKRFARHRINERRWMMAFFFLIAWLVLGAILNAQFLDLDRPSQYATSRGVLGSRASWPLTWVERYLVIGALLAVPVALRRYFKKGHWLTPARWVNPFR